MIVTIMAMRQMYSMAFQPLPYFGRCSSCRAYARQLEDPVHLGLQAVRDVRKHIFKLTPHESIHQPMPALITKAKSFSSP